MLDFNTIESMYGIFKVNLCYNKKRSWFQKTEVKEVKIDGEKLLS